MLHSLCLGEGLGETPSPRFLHISYLFFPPCDSILSVIVIAAKYGNGQSCVPVSVCLCACGMCIAICYPSDTRCALFQCLSH